MNRVRPSRVVAAMLLTSLALGSNPQSSAAAGSPWARTVPHYDHIIVIVEENKGYATVLDRGCAPNISRFAMPACIR
jgi:hypothetical protein